MKYSLFTYIMILICCTASCSRVPKGILTEKQMRSVLYDMQMAEAMIETERSAYRTNEDRLRVYNAVFAKHNITQAEYDSSLIWYGKNMDLYVQIYKLVLGDVNKNIEALGDTKPDPLSGDFANTDSIDIWVYDKAFAFAPTKVFDALKFDISPEKPYTKGSSYVLSFDVWGITQGQKHTPKARIRTFQADTVITANIDLAADGYHEATIITKDSKPVNRICGYIMMNDADASYRRIYINNIRLMKYNLGSKAATAPKAGSANHKP